MRVLLGLFLFLFFSNSYAQEIMVLDRGSRIPLSNVAIYNKERTRSTLTNLDGIANISGFSSDQILIFKHVSHHELRIKKSDIKLNYKVYLIPDENQLQEVVLSVSKFAQNKRDLPRQVVSITSEEIQFSNSQTAADLLESSGKVYVQKSQLGGGSPMIRGFATNRLLITVDGVRMNNAIFRSGNLQNVISIDPLAVERAEVILGPGSIIFGSDAVGGVMNFYTLTPEFAMGRNTVVSGNAYSRYASASDEKTIHADFNIGRKNWVFLTSITYSDFGDLKMGSHGPDEYLRNEYVINSNGNDRIVSNQDPRIQKPTGYNQINMLEKIRYMPNEFWDFSLNFMYSTTSDFPRYDRLIQKRNGQLRSSEWYYGPQTWFMGNFKIDKVGSGVFYDNAQLTAAYQYFKESRNNRDFGSELLFNSEENVDAWSVNLDYEKKFEKSKLNYGAEYVLNEISSEGRQINRTTGNSNADMPRYPDGSSWQSLAAYSGFQWELHPELTLQTGARYNHIFLIADFDDAVYQYPFKNADLSTGALTGSAGLSWDPSEKINWKLNFSTAFRAPNIDDVGKIFDSEPGSVVVPNPDLKPEYAYNGEIAVNWKISQAIRVDVASFYTHLDNALIRRDFSFNGVETIDYQGEPSNVQAIQNGANAYVYGFEGGIVINFSPSLLLNSQFTITEGKEELDNGTTAPLRHAAPLFGNTHLVWQRDKLKLDLFGEYNGQFDYEDLAPSEQGKAYLYAIDQNGNPYAPSWYTINFTGQYEISANWQATASLENITDQRYRTYSSGIAAAGRNLILALKFSF
ncbi:TonB-dependent receptor plug domain-containing protein [Gillisia sp. Q332]|uniref:TonB-dependent receptor plug domain-containing protein n=1 Tax=Gillisia xinjiangensis TaxID=3384765 RepID=UPI00391951FC